MTDTKSWEGMMEAFRAMMGEELDKRLSNIATKTDLDVIKTEVSELREDNKKIKSELNTVQQKLSESERRLESIERKNCEKRLIWRGLKISDNLSMEVRKVCQEVLKVPEEIIIEKVEQIGKNSKNPAILVEFAKKEDVNKVLLQTKQLKGTKISIDRELTKTGWERKKMLLKARKIIKEIDNSKVIKIIGDKMKIENKVFLWRNSKLYYGDADATTELEKMYNKNFSHLYSEVDKLEDKRRTQ